MAKMILVFLIVFALVYGGIELIRSMSKSERWALTKTMTYAIIIAAVSTALLSTIVFLF